MNYFYRFYFCFICFLPFLSPGNCMMSDQTDESEEYRRTSSSLRYEHLFVYVNKYNPTTLDLHGISSITAAHTKFLEFVQAAILKGKKNITVITGRGKHINRGGNRGTLFNLLPSWLENPAIKNHILYCQPARSEGSYDLLLREKQVTRDFLRQEKQIFLEAKSLEDIVKKRAKKSQVAKKNKRRNRHQKQRVACVYKQEKIDNSPQLIMNVSEVSMSITELKNLYVEQESQEACLRKLQLWDFLNEDAQVLLK